MPETVDHPEHYNAGTVECITAAEAATVGLDNVETICVFNVIKYIWRFKHKNGLEDLNKATWYLNRLRMYEKKVGNRGE